MSGHILGDFRTQQNIIHPHTLEYWQQRDCVIDCRQPNMIDIHPTANFGHRVKLYVQSHNPMPGMFGDVVARPIKIEANAWIASECILFNCLIGEGAILAVGSVVRSKIVPPWVMVEGNPGRIFKRFINGGWHGCSEELGAMHR